MPAACLAARDDGVNHDQYHHIWSSRETQTTTKLNTFTHITMK
jgi:hypothetical protein